MARNKGVRLGLMPPVTGVVGIYGQEITWAGQLACEEVNESGGVLGRPLQLFIEDDGSLPESAVVAARKLLERDRCIALIGNLMTNSRIAVTYRVAEPRRVPILCFSLYEGSVLSRYYFHFAALPNQQIDLMIPYMARHYGSKMFFCGNSYEWPRGSIDAAQRALEKEGGTRVGEEYLPIGVGKEAAKQLMERLSRSGANVLVPFFAGEDELTILNALYESGLKEKIRVVMTHYDEIMASHLSPSARDGLFSINSYFMSLSTPENQEFLSRISRLPGVTGLWPEGNGILTNFGEATYLCVKAFAQAVNRAGSLDSEVLIASLEKVELVGPQGRVRMDPETHHAAVNSYLARGRVNGTFEVIEKFGAIPPVIPLRYRHMRISPASSLEDLRVEARIIEQMTDAICLINVSDNSLVFVNPAFERMFGYTRDELIGTPASKVADSAESTGGLLPEEVNKTLYQSGIWRGEIRCHNKKGQELWCLVSISALTHAYYGEVWIAILHDISDRKKFEVELIHAKDSAEKASRSKARFLDVAAHELRTPITGLSLLLQLTQSQLKHEGRPVTLETLEKLRAQTDRISRLVVDLLDVSRLERGVVQLNRMPTNLLDLVNECVELFRPQAFDRNFTLSSSGCPVDVSIDRDRIFQVLSNFLDNAIKYTPSGSPIEIAVKFGPNRVSVSVVDHGPGIDEQQISSLFQPFERGSGQAQIRVMGLGLGLFVGRGIIELHDGKIGVESKVGSGSTFFFEIPISVSSGGSR